ncbi:MAG: hypothetical protein ACOXZQ_01105 [Bacteroidales bacterium]
MKTKLDILSAILFASLITIPLNSQVRLPRLISDGMVAAARY